MHLVQGELFLSAEEMGCCVLYSMPSDSGDCVRPVGGGCVSTVCRLPRVIPAYSVLTRTRREPQGTLPPRGSGVPVCAVLPALLLGPSRGLPLQEMGVQGRVSTSISGVGRLMSASGRGNRAERFLQGNLISALQMSLPAGKCSHSVEENDGLGTLLLLLGVRHPSCRLGSG